MLTHQPWLISRHPRRAGGWGSHHGAGKAGDIPRLVLHGKNGQVLLRPDEHQQVTAATLCDEPPDTPMSRTRQTRTKWVHMRSQSGKLSYDVGIRDRNCHQGGCEMSFSGPVTPLCSLQFFKSRAYDLHAFSCVCQLGILVSSITSIYFNIRTRFTK